MAMAGHVGYTATGQDDNNDLPAIYELAITLHHAKQTDQAIQTFEQGLSLNQNFFTPLQSKLV